MKKQSTHWLRSSLGLLSSCAIVFLTACISTLNPTAGTHETLPEIVISEPLYDFGYAGPGQTIHHLFPITNHGTGILKIEGIKTPCGTTATVSSEEIHPGETAEIQMVFDAPPFDGRLSKAMTVASNDPSHPETILTIKGEIKRDLAVIPQGIDFGTVKYGTRETRRLRLLQLSTPPFKLEKVLADPKRYHIETTTFTEENSHGFEIRVTLPEDAPPGRIMDTITLCTSLARHPRIDIWIFAEIIK